MFAFPLFRQFLHQQIRPAGNVFHMPCSFQTQIKVPRTQISKSGISGSAESGKQVLGMGSAFGSDNRGIRHLGLYGIPFSEVTAETDTQVLGGLKTGIHQMKRLPIQMSHIHFQVARNIMRFQDTIQMRLDIHGPVFHCQ